MQIVLAALGMAVDMCRVDMIYYNIYGRLHSRKTKQGNDVQTNTAETGPASGWFKMAVLPKGFRVPGACGSDTQWRKLTIAMNIEHAIERSSAFVVIVVSLP